MTRILFTVLPLLVPLPLLAADWPQWRGPERDGVAPGFKLPAKWPAEPKPKWKATVGEGYSGPAIAGGKVFILGKLDGKERCLCFDANTGNELWKIEYPEQFQAPDPTAGKGPNSTPTVDRDRVYMLGLGGQFHCIEIATGKVLWKHDCMKEYWGVEVQEEMGLKVDAWFPVCGASASALVDGEQVIVPIGGKKAGTFTAFDRKTGEIVWKALEERSSYASPIIRSPGGVKQIIGFTGLRMVGLDYKTHKVLWDHPMKTRFEQTIISPVVWRDLVIICGEARTTVALRIIEENGKVRAEPAWKTDDLRTYLTTPVVFGDHLVGHDMRTNRLACINLSTGETAWTSPRVPGKYHSIVVAGNAILVLNSEGELYGFEATPKECVELGKWKVADKVTWSYLGVADNRLYVKDKDTLYCYEVK
jgi:outer membrane protein assembly factor BamB